MSLPSFITGPSQDQAAQAAMPTPEALARRQALAMALLRAGSDSSPIRSPWQGVARVSDAISGAIQSHWADQDAAKAMQSGADMYAQGLSRAFGGLGSGAGGAGPQAAVTPGTGAANTGDIGTNLPPDGLAKQAFDFFVNKGYTPAAAAGLVGNFQQESGFSPGNIAAVSGGGDGGVSKHLAQWNGARLTGLNNYAASVGQSPSDFNTQLGYVDWELNNTEKKTGDALRGVTDPGQAAYIAAGYERPQGWREGGSAGLINGWNNRLSYAQNAFNQWGNGGQVAANAPAAPPPVADAGNVPLPPQDPRGVQVASADPSFVPQMPPTGAAGPQAAIGVSQSAPPPAAMTGANAAPEMAQMGLKPLPIANGAPMPPNAGAPAPTVNPATGLVPDAALKQGNFNDGSLSPAQAKAFADAGYNVPNSAINWNGQDAALPPTPAPTSGAPGVTNAMLAGGPQPAAAPNLSPGAQKVADALSPQPIAPPAPVAAFQGVQGQPGVGQDQLRSLAAVMANPWISDSQKQMLNNTIMSRLMPHRMVPVDTGNGTALIDEITGQQRGFIPVTKPVDKVNIGTGTAFVDPITGQQRGFLPSANNQVIENQDGSRTIVNTNDPNAVTAFNNHGGPAVAGQLLPGQKTIAQMFPGQKPTPDMQNYLTYYNQRVQAGDDPSKIEDIKQYEMDKKSPLVTMSQETEYNKERGKALAGNVNQYLDGGKNAYAELQALNTIDDALASGKGHIFTGPGSEMALNVKQAIGNLFGVNPEGTGASEIINKTGAQLASAAAKNLASRPTQFDFATFLKNNPGLDLSPQGNAFMINVMKQQAQHEIDLGNKAAHYKGDGSDWQDTVDQYYKDHPFLSPITGKPLDAKQTLFPAAGANGQQGQEGSQGQPGIAAPKSADEYNALPSGTRFTAPDGSVRIKP